MMFNGPLLGHLRTKIDGARGSSRACKKDRAAKRKLTTGNKDDMRLDRREGKFLETMTGTLSDSRAERCTESNSLRNVRLLMIAVGPLRGSFSENSMYPRNPPLR
jgi:hypothetical protein